jgi:hypothetical protein
VQYPPTYRLTGEFLRERWKNLKAAFGDSEAAAREVVLADPQLLTCLTWDATLARLDRTGVVSLTPEATPTPQQAAAQEPPPRRSRSGAGRIKEPQRAAKTVKGAAEVAAAVARAQRQGRPQ